MMTSSPSETEPGLACHLPAAERGARSDAIRPLFAAVQGIVELEDGYSFAFPGDAPWAGRLLEFILAERACCPFFTFALVFAPDHTVISLQLRGSASIKALIAADWLADMPLGSGPPAV